MKNRQILGGVLALIAAAMGIVGHIVLFLQWYRIGMSTESAEPGCEILLKYVHPAMADFGLLAGVLFAVSTYGFFTGRQWAFFLTTIGLVLALLGSWFVNVPYMAAGLPPIYFLLFWPYLLLYFLFLRLVGRITWRQTLLGLFTGMAYIFCWMNGVSSTSRIITNGDPIFVLVQRLHWVAMLGWAVVTLAIMHKPREWTRVTGLIAATTELVVGIPLAAVTAQQLGRFSLFALAPIASLGLLIILTVPRWWAYFAPASE
jgi:hypothetical protein